MDRGGAALMRELIDRYNEHWAFIRRSDHPNSNLAIFIHGFRGEYLRTWGKLPDLVKRNADSDRDFCDWDFLFLGYSTRDIESYLDIASIIRTHWRQALEGNAPFEQPYEHLALFGHSLGTLGVRQLLCAYVAQPPRMMGDLHSVTLFGTPLDGSPWARFAFGYPIAAALKPYNPQLRMLRVWSECAYALHPWRNVYVILGQGDNIVGHESAELIQWPGDDNPDHMK